MFLTNGAEGIGHPQAKRKTNNDLNLTHNANINSKISHGLKI